MTNWDAFVEQSVLSLSNTRKRRNTFFRTVASTQISCIVIDARSLVRSRGYAV